jgi:hypothetical protein
VKLSVYNLLNQQRKVSVPELVTRDVDGDAQLPEGARLRDGGLDLPRVGDVGRDEPGALLPQPRDHRAAVGGGQVQQHDARAGCVEGGRGRSSEPGGAAGDERDVTVGELHGDS